ncbi:FkbM family methyltransferase [Pelagibius litoralis]|uniref:FkbM family methyltransferase n=1 Tax=Pelagibius litoralis TaxID=374515 RepID=A0A967F1Z3_9PROT|nr:FkbM family methyltransferase [Pelagibius litoralis]NIA71507.1 FkbM family methyltransferase [Pelagibius litoralis]
MAELGHAKLKGARQRAAKLRFSLARRLMGRYRLHDEGHTYRFDPASFRELWRISSIYLKETGTVELIRSELREGDVFCDIGANIGLYSLMAAARTGTSGQVYAFEPLAANFASLVENIRLNGYCDRITPFSLALTDGPGVFPFHYLSTEPGSSGSQLHEAIDVDEARYLPLVTEMKYGTSLDQLIRSGSTRAPTVIKIDVDGNEARILRGMQSLLAGSHRPRVISVEVNAREKAALFGFMESQGYAFSGRNDTMGGLRRIRAGADPEMIAYNAVFKPAEIVAAAC